MSETSAAVAVTPEATVKADPRQKLFDRLNAHSSRRDNEDGDGFDGRMAEYKKTIDGLSDADLGTLTRYASDMRATTDNDNTAVEREYGALRTVLEFIQSERSRGNLGPIEYGGATYGVSKVQSASGK